MWEKLKEKRADGGFTLIELLIVIIILAILAAIVVFAVGSTSKNSVVASCKADAKSVETATEAFKAQTGTWPGGARAGGYGGTWGDVVTQSFSTTGAPAYYVGPADTASTGNPVGPWMRTIPSSTLHYNITVNTTNGKVFVNTILAGTESTTTGLDFDTSSPNVCEGAS